MTAVANVSAMTQGELILKHLRKVGSISIREAMDDYSISGGTLTKLMHVLRRRGNAIVKEMRSHPLSGRRYARYYLDNTAPTSNPCKDITITPIAKPEFNPGDKVRI